jgi:hypothetical protein
MLEKILMNKANTMGAAVLRAAAAFAAVLAWGQGAASTQPTPPPQICVDNQCTASLVSPPPSGGSGSHVIKWNPGHYMGSNTVLSASSTISKVQSEMDDINNQDAIQGYRIFITWGALERAQGVYDFSTIDAILNRLTTAYNKPKRLALMLWIYGQQAIRQNDSSVIPMYIQQDPKYGASPVAGRYGWWGQASGGASTGMYAAAAYNPAVMDRLIALVQALGKHLDGNPYFEAFDFQEDATIAQAASGMGSADPNYSDAAWLAQLQRFLTAATAAFPHTSVIMDNSWFDRPASGVALEKWMVANRVAPGSSDTWGQSAIDSYGTSHLSDGMQTLMGTDQNGGLVDLRPQTRAMVQVEGPDILGPYFGQYGGPWSPADIVNAMNQSYWASHVFWTHLFGTEVFRGAGVLPQAKWTNLAPTLAQHPLTHTDYPPNYP